jgi:four helix bundle protein
MWAKKIEDLEAFQLANEFKREVYRLVAASPYAERDYKFKSQITDASAGAERTINEGYHRQHNGEFFNFLRYALASLAEARGHVRDGVDRGYWSASDTAAALRLGKRCNDVVEKLMVRIKRGIENERKSRKPRTRRKKP